MADKRGTFQRILFFFSSSKNALFLLILIFFFGFFLRFYNLSNNPPSLYVDEISMGLDAYNVLRTGHDQFGAIMPLFFRSFGDYKLPIYIYLVTGSMELFGKNEFAIRFPSALAGSLTVLLVYFLTCEALHTKNKKKQAAARLIGVIASLLVAISSWNLHFSRGGFEVTVAVFIFVLGMFLAVRYWNHRNPLFLFLSCCSFVAAMYTYQSYRIIVPIIFVIGIFLLVRQKLNRWALIAACFLVFFLSLPLILFSFNPHGIARFSQTSAFTSSNRSSSSFIRVIQDPLILVHNYVSFFSFTYLFRFGDQNNRHQIHDFGLLYLWQLPYIVAGLYLLSKSKDKRIATLLFFFLLVGPIPAALATPSPHSLRVLLGSIGYSMLTALGVYQLLLQKSKWIHPFFLSTIFIAVVLFAYYMHFYHNHYVQEGLLDWGGPCKRVARSIAREKTHVDGIYIDKNLPCIPEYFAFYIPETPLIRVDVRWVKPASLGNKKILYVRPYYGKRLPEHLFTNIYLPGLRSDIFAQLFIL